MIAYGPFLSCPGPRWGGVGVACSSLQRGHLLGLLSPQTQQSREALGGRAIDSKPRRPAKATLKIPSYPMMEKLFEI